MSPVASPDELPCVLFVDDEVNIRRSLIRLFRNEPVRVREAGSGEQALEVLEREPVQVVVSDHRMPGMTGATLLSRVRRRWPETIRMMLTGFTEMGVAVEAINQGEIYRLVTKPWNDEELRATIRTALDTWRMRREIERLNKLTQEQNAELQDMNRTLEAKVEDRTKEVQQSHQELRLAYLSTVKTLAEAIEAKDPYTRGHSERVGVYSSRIARELGCESRFIERIYLAGLLHDVGKIGISDAIITKPGRLTDDPCRPHGRRPELGGGPRRPLPQPPAARRRTPRATEHEPRSDRHRPVQRSGAPAHRELRPALP